VKVTDPPRRHRISVPSLRPHLASAAVGASLPFGLKSPGTDRAGRQLIVAGHRSCPPRRCTGRTVIAVGGRTEPRVPPPTPSGASLLSIAELRLSDGLPLPAARLRIAVGRAARSSHTGTWLHSTRGPTDHIAAICAFPRTRQSE
jgi:hypothetical protein